MTAVLHELRTGACTRTGRLMCTTERLMVRGYRRETSMTIGEAVAIWHGTPHFFYKLPKLKRRDLVLRKISWEVYVGKLVGNLWAF